MRKLLLYVGLPVVLLFIVYLLGPAPAAPKWSKAMPQVPDDAEELEQYVAANEARHQLKPDNEARIIWADSTHKKTPYSVIYLHGFSASQEEGDPVHTNFAHEFGCNLYLARLADHGVDTTEQMLYFTPDRYWESAKQALAIGKALGDRVIIVSTSSGSTVGLVLAAEYPQDVFALINMSPNIAINNPLAFVSNNHWGLQVARLVKDGKYNVPGAAPWVDEKINHRYWNDKYRLEAVCQLQEMIESKMNKSTFEKVTQPSLTLYYYKNEQEQDQTAMVSAMLKMNEQLGTPAESKEAIAVPTTGHHIMGSYVFSKDIAVVEAAIEKFAIEKLKMPVVNPR